MLRGAWTRWGSETLARFRRQADAFSIGFRKFQVEAFRAYENHAGWVMNHIRDVPGARLRVYGRPGPPALHARADAAMAG